jgi:hypothetical protein
LYNSQKGKQAQITKYIKENYFKLNMKKKKKLPAEFAVAQKHKLDPKKRKRNSRSTTAQRLALNEKKN